MPEFFGKVDRTKEGKISSEYPAWYFDRQTELLQESIDQKERALKGGHVPRESEGEYQIIIDREKKRLAEIIDSRPKLSGTDLDKCAKAYKSTIKEISNSMYTRSDSMRGFVDPHDEHKLNSTPCIKVTDVTAEIALQNGIRITDNGHMARKDAERLCKIIGRAIGENTNMERLRKDGKSMPLKYR